jgi:hypothetical protein
MNNKTETLNCAPSWEATALMLVTILQDSKDFEGRKYAKDEIIRMGKIIDQLMAEREEDSI